jgi:beta-glucosidase
MAKFPYSFPKNFLWGVAAASAQIEGATSEGGKGESVWDRFSKTPGKIIDGTGTDPACDHFHRFASDFAMMRELGVKNYRLSISWPRIYPNGTGDYEPRGLDFYDRLIDSCLEHGITPWVTLYHWDLPQALEDQNGWINRATVDAFANYAQTVVKRLSDRVSNWFTLNEMPCFIGLSYETGIHAPGRQENAQLVNQAYHHALVAHGHAVAAVREYGSRKAKVGLVHNPPTPIPLTETEADIEAAKIEYARVTGQLMTPIYTGGYPLQFLRAAGANRPKPLKGDMEIIQRPGDYLGLNLYAGYFVRAAQSGGRSKKIVPEKLPFPTGFPQGDLPWINITPQTLYWAIRLAHEVHGVPSFYISENGMAADDRVTENGEILDLDRREYLRNYLIGLHRASEEGFDIRGYFLWTWMDNFEWAEGYSKRFGIVYNDYATQTRTPKLSAQWYSRVMAENRIV